MIGHDNNQNVFSFNHPRHPCCAQLFNMLAVGTGAGINKRHQGMKAEVTSGSVVPEANIQVVTAGSERELNPIAEMQRNPMPAPLLCALCVGPHSRNPTNEEESHCWAQWWWIRVEKRAIWNLRSRALPSYIIRVLRKRRLLCDTLISEQNKNKTDGSPPHPVPSRHLQRDKDHRYNQVQIPMNI